MEPVGVRGRAHYRTFVIEVTKIGKSKGQDVSGRDLDGSGRSPDMTMSIWMTVRGVGGDGWG